jgi:Fe-S cluster biogenesis protein NfuA
MPVLCSQRSYTIATIFLPWRFFFWYLERMFIQTESTPNPNTRKFFPGKPVLPLGTLEFATQDSAQNSPLASRIFIIPEVSGVLLGQDFIAVTKREGEWLHINPAVLGAIMEHYVSGEPVLSQDGQHCRASTSQTAHHAEIYAPEDRETVVKIKELLETRIQPAVQNDGGMVVFRAFQKGIVYLEMKGACRGCPSSSATLQNGIRGLLTHFLPEVQDVHPWSDDFLSYFPA